MKLKIFVSVKTFLRNILRYRMNFSRSNSSFFSI